MGLPFSFGEVVVLPIADGEAGGFGRREAGRHLRRIDEAEGGQIEQHGPFAPCPKPKRTLPPSAASANASRRLPRISAVTPSCQTRFAAVRRDQPEGGIGRPRRDAGAGRAEAA